MEENNNREEISPIQYCTPSFIEVDSWIPQEEDVIFRTAKGVIILPVSKFYNCKPNLDYFVVTMKRCYNNEIMRMHICHYMNYFLKYYDQDKEYLAIMCHLKFIIDTMPNYNEDAFIYDLNRYIFTGNIAIKLGFMNKDNYILDLDPYRNKKNPNLQYNNHHAEILYKMSLLMIAVIPLITHFAYAKEMSGNIDNFILKVYDRIINLYDVDIYSKIYETASTSINMNARNNAILWAKQDIRGINKTTHAMENIKNILINIMPKYVYNENIVTYNYHSIIHNIKYQITDIDYGFDLKSISSSKRDIDANSDFDKFESYQTKQDEGLYIQNKVNCDQTMRNIELMFGPFNDEEIQFYNDQLSTDDKYMINPFQKELIFNLFYKYFGDPISIKAINKIDYIKLMISAKKILESNHFVLLPYIISGKVTRFVSRKNVNKKELIKIESSPYFRGIKEKYNNDKIEKYIMGLIATILSSDFQIISNDNPDINGQKIECIPEFVCEEILIYVQLI